MAVWLVRVGSHGEYEQKFIQEDRVYVTWEGLDTDLGGMGRATLIKVLPERYPEEKPKAIQNWANQIWPFASEMKTGDLVILPLKSQPAIQVAEITGDYHFEANGPSPYYH